MLKWASTSKQAKDIHKLMKVYVEEVQKCKVMLVNAKQLYKEKKNARALGVLAQGRKHDGPLSTDNAALLDSLSDEQVILELKYLKPPLPRNSK